jgi:hypothetical protein
MRMPPSDATRPSGIHKAWIVIAGLACAVLALLTIPALANAKSGYVVFPGHHEVELNLRGSNGYSIQITKTNRFVEMFANRDSTVAVYAIPRPQINDDAIDVDFAGVGRVSVEFHPVGPPHREGGFFPPCKGGKTVERRGYFQGTIRVQGEHGYTSADTDRASGRVVTAAKEICKRSVFGPSPPEPEEGKTRLFATSGPKHGRSVALSANTVNIGSFVTTYFTGSASERRKGMIIFRETLVRGAAADLSLSDTSNYPAAATVTPPAPFHGSAVFQRNPGGENSWIGPLSVALPGLGRVALAGPSFSAKLCRDSGCRSTRNRIALERRLIHGRVPASLG